jgi:hypothetical protein
MMTGMVPKPMDGARAFFLCLPLFPLLLEEDFVLATGIIIGATGTEAALAEPSE